MPTRARFTADQFTPTQWQTAAEKAKFANQFVTFVTGGYRRTQFPKWFYTRLSGTFGHIAHYDQNGFYNTFFTDAAGRERFVALTLNWRCYGSPEFTYCDVERALVAWLREHVALAA